MVGRSGDSPINNDFGASCSTCVCNDADRTKYEASDINIYDASSTNANGRSMRDRCCDGWDGTRCDICRTVDACPTTYDGSGRPHEVSSASRTDLNVARWLRPLRALGALGIRAMHTKLRTQIATYVLVVLAAQPVPPCDEPAGPLIHVESALARRL